MEVEHRKAQRVALKKEVMINGSIKGQGLDLSLGGLYVHTGRTFPEDQIVSVTLPLNAKHTSLQARIRHLQQSIGMGVQFISMTPEQESHIGDYIRSAVSAFGPEKKKTVLLVDDHASTGLMNRSRLILDGFTVQEAHDGSQALALLEKKDVDLVILDLSTEPLDGYKVLSLIRQKPGCREIPVLVLSSRSSRDDINGAMDAGATEFLVKMMTPPLKLSQRAKACLSEAN